MAVTLERHLIDTDTYHRMIDAGILTEDDRAELINGEIISMSPIGKLHMAIVDRISNLITGLVSKRAIVRTQSSILILNHSELEPDIALLRYRDDFYASRHAQSEDVLLIVEVAHTSWDTDYAVKRPLYATAGIPELCWSTSLSTKLKCTKPPHRAPTKTSAFCNRATRCGCPYPD